MKKAKRHTSNRGGQAILEYILLLSIIVIALGVFIRKITAGFDLSTARYGGSVEQQIRTGSAPASVWKK